MSINTKDILEVMQMAEELRPVAQTVVEQLESYGPLIKGLVKSIGLGLVDVKDQMVQEYVKRGYTLDQAILLVIDSETALKQAITRRNT